VQLRSRNDNDFNARYPGIVAGRKRRNAMALVNGKDVMAEPLVKRILPKLSEPVRYSPELKASLKDLIQSVKAQGLEGLVAKRRDSKYEPGLRSGAWQKMRVNQGQELVIAGYTPLPKNFDALVIGYYDTGKLIYAARTRNGFTPASRVRLFKKIKPLEIEDCPFANLPEKKAGRWGSGADRREDGRMPVAETGASRSV
jgi:bifunctional non-homologous end joining protein LigD